MGLFRSKPPASPNCTECVFHENNECHRHPPVVMVDTWKTAKKDGYEGKGFCTVYPNVDQWDWCGEFEPLEQEDEQ